MLSSELKHSILALCEDTDTPRSLAVKILLDAKEYGELMHLRCDPLHYSNASSYFLDNQVTELLRKSNLRTGVDKKRAALDTFFECERGCARTNNRIRLVGLDLEYNTGISVSPTILHSVERGIRFTHRVFGAIPTEFNGRFGPGSVFEPYIKRATWSVPDKLANKAPSVTIEALPFLYLFQDRWTSDVLRDYTIVRGNRFTTVPKDGLKDRGICIEPSINVYMQLGIGSYLKHRIRRCCKIDLSGTPENCTGQYLHHELLRQQDHGWSTIDLSNASDTVSKELVKLFVPRDWFHLLDACRSRCTTVKNKTYHLEKFSSMGNGFTFELETILFLAIGYSIGLKPGHTIFAYGDDIIVPKPFFSRMCAMLKFFGFSPNERKSFHTGRFFESCGEDFFDGVPVRAYYIKEIPHEPQHFIAMANGFRRSFTKHGFNHEPSSPHWRSWRRTLRQLPSHILRCTGPEYLNDNVIHVDRPYWNCKRINWITYVRGYVPVQGKSLNFDKYDEVTQLLSALYGVWDSPNSNRGPYLTLRSSVKGHRVAWLPTGY